MGKHSVEKAFTCYECEAIFPESRNFKYCMSTRTGEKPYTCHQCGAEFEEKTSAHSYCGETIQM